MFGKQQEKKTKNMETIIGPSVLVKGTLTSKGGVLVDGGLEGFLKSGGLVVVGSEANIKADIEAASADISGQVTGNLLIDTSLILRSGAKINGDVKCSSISIEEGGLLNGKCDMVGQESKEKPLPLIKERKAD
jgi:cytoskeletal protein CcmA (bactofilin family)